MTHCVLSSTTTRCELVLCTKTVYMRQIVPMSAVKRLTLKILQIINNTTTATRTMDNRLHHICKSNQSKVKLNVGGKVFTTSIATLCSEKDSIFSVMFNGNFDMSPDEDGEYFIDRDPHLFPILLKHLRGYDVADTITQLNDLDKRQLAEDIDFFQIGSMFNFFPSFFSNDVFCEPADSVVVSKIAVPLKNGSVKIIDMKTGKVLQTIPKRHTYGRDLLACPEEKIVSVDDHGTIYVWDCLSGQCLHTLSKEVYPDSEQTLLFQVSDHLIASARCGHVSKSNHGKIHIWDIHSGQHMHALDHFGAVSKFVKLNKPNSFLVASNKSLSVWEVTESQASQKFRVILQKKIKKKSITEVSDQTIAFFDEKGVKIWDVAKFQCIQNIDTAFRGRTIWSFAKKKIALVNDTDVTIFDTSSGKQLLNIKYNYCAVRLCNTSLATYNAEQQLIEIWDTTSAKRSKALISQHSGGISSIVKLSDSRMVTAGGSTVNIWDIVEGTCLRTFHYSGSLIRLSKQAIASVKYYNHSLTVTVWDIESGSCLHNIHESDYDYNCEILSL